MERNADDPDADMFTDEKESFPSTYRHGGSTKFANEYVLHLAPNSNHKQLAAGLGNSKVAILDASTMTKSLTFEAAQPSGGVLTGVVFSKKSDQIVYTCASGEDSVNMWDLRQESSGNRKPTKSFVDSSSVSAGGSGRSGKKKPILSMDVNCEDTFLAAGTEQVVEDAFVLFWDVRNPEKMLGGYWDSFGQDVTSVRFHGDDANKLATGGADHLINVFDISQETEDDALITTLNSESPIKKVMWYSGKGKDSIAGVSEDEELVLWPNVDGIEHKTFTRDDLTVAVRRKTAEWCYLIDAHYKADSQEVVVVAKSDYPKKRCLRLATVKKNKMKPYADLKLTTGNSPPVGVVRCSAFDSLSGSLFTGDEGGYLHVWMKET